MKRPAAFWKWFAENRVAIERGVLSLRSGRPVDQILTEGLRQALQNAGFDLAHEIGQQPSGKFHLIISADGERSKIEDVVALTRAAINVDNWEVTAFRPPSNERYGVVIQQNRVVATDPMWFFIEETPEHTAVCVVFDAPEAFKFSSPELSFVAKRFIEARIGEYKLMNDIDYVFGVPKYPDAPFPALTPFEDFEGTLNELEGRFPQ